MFYSYNFKKPVLIMLKTMKILHDLYTDKYIPLWQVTNVTCDILYSEFIKYMCAIKNYSIIVLT